jgi:hypothetical protein
MGEPPPLSGRGIGEPEITTGSERVSARGMGLEKFSDAGMGL